MERLKVAVLPPGAFGMAMAVPLLANEHDVTLGFRSWEKAEQFKRSHQSDRLPGVSLPANLRVTGSLEKAVENADLVVVATPSRQLESFYSEYIRPNLRKNALLLCVTKGLYNNLRPSEVITGLDPEVAPRLAVSSGPTFAQDVAMGLPAATVIASERAETVEKIAEIYHSRVFRVYKGDDVVGVEMGGALKNVIAVAAGICDGLRKGESGRAALIQRGWLETARLAITQGARWETLVGLSGMGDLMLTCTSYKSRNHQAGVDLVLGKTPEELISSDKTIEGFDTAKVAVQLAKQHQLEVPICDSIYQVVFCGMSIEEVINQLLDRPSMYENGDRVLN